MRFERKRDLIKTRNYLLDEIERKNKTIEELQAKLRGDIRDTGVQCTGCKNAVKVPDGLVSTMIACKLDFKCEDRVEE